MVDEKSRYFLDVVELDDFFTSAALSGRLLAEKNGFSFVASCDLQSAKEAFFDDGKIRQALDILYSSAIRGAAASAGVRFLLHAEPEKLVFTVQASAQAPAREGSIGKDNLDSEFENARKIVERHGGEISWQNTMAQGLTLSFWLPLGELAHGC